MNPGGQLEDRLRLTLTRAKASAYVGFDPYDHLLSPVATRSGKLGRLLLLQSGVYSPINLRSLLRIPPGVSTKGLALFAEANARFFATTQEEAYRTEAERLAEILWSRRVGNAPTWSSYYFPYDLLSHKLAPGLPDIVGTTRVANAFSALYEATGQNDLKDRTTSIVAEAEKKFIGENKGRVFIRYTPEDNAKIVYNVTALFLEAAGNLRRIGGELPSCTNDLVVTLLDAQEEDGSWAYSTYFKNDRVYRQIDYHQGFILDGLQKVAEYLPKVLHDKTVAAIRRGMAFYADRQFTTHGRAHYRLPLSYPADIHNQAQGILTFSWAVREDLVTPDRFSSVWNWTQEHMWCEEGYFRGHKYPIGGSRIEYIRWGQAWMALAMASVHQRGILN